MALEKDKRCKETLGIGRLTFGYAFCFKLEWFESPGNSSDFSFFFFFKVNLWQEQGGKKLSRKLQ